jgi:hypothetical protein
MSPRLNNALLAALLAASSGASGQTTQAEAFADGKAHKSKNADIKNGINAGALTNVPAQDAATTNDLKGMYGSNLINQGQNKVAACAAYVPGSDAYKNQECETVNYMVGNPSARPQYVIDKVNDPLVVTSNNIRNTPGTHTTGTSGLAGNYTACVNQTTNQPAKYDTERCQVGRPVVEGQCAATLNVSYTWQSFANQPGADMRYGRCSAGALRGDQLTIPLANAYRTEQLQCSARGWGQGVFIRILYKDCTGAEVEHGYNATGCSAPPPVVVNDPPRQAIASCTNAPRNNENCFTPAGAFTAKAEVPVFVDNWDYSACADLNAHGAVIQN